MEALRLFKSLNRAQRNTFIACFLGWTLDALDFFLLTFVFVPVAHDFGRTIPQVTFAITITLMMRPLGAFIFGWLGDRFGRRIPLMIDIVFYSVIELLTAFAPEFRDVSVVAGLVRDRDGRRMGPGCVARDGIVADAQRAVCSREFCNKAMPSAISWPRWFTGSCFQFSGGAACLSRARCRRCSLFIFARTCRSHRFGNGIAQRRNASNSICGASLKEHGRLLIYAALLMTAFNYMSHGTQDLYPTFLEKQRGFGVSAKSTITIVYAIGMICGGTVVGFLSQRWGRRRCIILSAICGMLLIPAWIFSPGTPLLIAGGFLMQFMVQGAWGVVPVHLNELSPAEFRGTFPGLAYQLGNFAAAYAAQQQAWLADHFRDANGNPNYALTMALVECFVFLAIILLAAIGPEKRGREF